MKIKCSKLLITIIIYFIVLSPCILHAANVSYRATISAVQDDEEMSLQNQGFRTGDVMTIELNYEKYSAPDSTSTSDTGSVSHFSNTIQYLCIYNDYFYEEIFNNRQIAQNDNYYGTNEDYFIVGSQLDLVTVPGSVLADFYFSFRGNDNLITDSTQLINPPNPNDWVSTNGWLSWQMPCDEFGNCQLVQVRLNNFQLIPIPSEVDLDNDGDVDGFDLVYYISDSMGISLESLAEDFGKNELPTNYILESN